MLMVKVMMSASVVLGSTLLAQAAGTYFDTTYNQGGLGSINYRVYLPESYSPGAEMPVVLYLHSAAERGNSVNDIFENNYPGFTWTNDWIGGLVDATQTGEHQAILVMPQSGLGNYWNSMTNGENWNTPNYNNAVQNATPISPRLQLAVNALGQVISNYSTDANRVYVTGPSMGGWGTWDALARFPNLFAAGMPLSGGGNVEAAGTTLANKPVWMMHGALDGLITVGHTDQLYQAMQNAGGSPIYSRIANEGHGGWELFYQDDYYTTVTPNNNTGLGSSIYDWLFAQSLENQGPVQPPALDKAPIVLNIGPGDQSNNNSFDYTADGQRMIVFNHLEGIPISNMKDINGNETGINVSFTSTGSVGPGHGVDTPGPTVGGIFPQASTWLGLYVLGNNNTMTFTFSGMDDESTYKLDVFAGVIVILLRVSPGLCWMVRKPKPNPLMWLATSMDF
ncbi:MAG: hypothetical protein HC898_04000 [Phycisphaerales bacterium]|nr:hypothetical protein [Phycisphaerales bacterium]